jgi:hypothetical protein
MAGAVHIWAQELEAPLTDQYFDPEYATTREVAFLDQTTQASKGRRTPAALRRSRQRWNAADEAVKAAVAAVGQTETPETIAALDGAVLELYAAGGGFSFLSAVHEQPGANPFVAAVEFLVALTYGHEVRHTRHSEHLTVLQEPCRPLTELTLSLQGALSSFPPSEAALTRLVRAARSQGSRWVRRPHRQDQSLGGRDKIFCCTKTVDTALVFSLS